MKAPTIDQMVFLNALQGKSIYLGTVSQKTKERRRAKSKIARASRRKNRG